MEFMLFDIPIDIFALSYKPSFLHQVAESISQALWTGTFISVIIEFISDRWL